MNDREAQQKFAEKTNIKKSEFDRINTSQTRNSVGTSQGSNLLPKDLEKKNKGYYGDLGTMLISLIIAILVFFAASLLIQSIAPIFYEGILFLLLNLLLSVAVYFSFYALLKKIKKDKRRKMKR